MVDAGFVALFKQIALQDCGADFVFYTQRQKQLIRPFNHSRTTRKLMDAPSKLLLSVLTLFTPP